MERTSSSFFRLAALTAAVLSPLALGACNNNNGSSSAGDMAQQGDSGGTPPATALDPVPLTDTVNVPGATGPVDVVRDEWGIPHIYGSDLGDVAWAQGYTMAEDRLLFMDLGRRQAEGTLSEVVGDLLPAALDSDISMRLHHLRSTSQKILDELNASTDPYDQQLSRMLSRFVAGINAYIVDLQAGRYSLPPAALLVYGAKSATPWDVQDVLSLGLLQAFSLSYDADSDIDRTLIDKAAQTVFAQSNNPDMRALAGISQDLEILAPFDPTFTIDGWTGMNGDTSTASRALPDPNGDLLAALEGAVPAVRGFGDDHLTFPERGSNNWIIAPKLSKSGHVLVANDTHLDLGNPATFYLNHLKVTGATLPTDVMGVQFPGIPGVILGMNEHIAWGATVNNIDVTDVYEDTVVPCDNSSDPCVMFKGQKVPLVKRVEAFKIGSFGKTSSTKMITFWDDPNHGPIIPRITATHDIEPLGSTELSVRWTGHEPAQLFRAVLGLDRAATMHDAVAALDRDFRYGGQNWVIGDDQGHIGWTQTIRVPRRQAGTVPWKVLPGDGSAEWGADMDPKYIPHAYDPDKGYIATANNDPIGVTADNEPFATEPVVDGAPLYLGADYDPGTRVGRITKRIQAATMNGGKLTLDDMQSIQADAVSEWDQAFQPTLLDAAQALAAEIATPGTNPDLATMLAAADAKDRANVPMVVTLLQGWTYDTPSGLDSENPTAQQVTDSRATMILSAWLGRFAQAALGDELKLLGQSPGSASEMKLLAKMCKDSSDPTGPSSLATGLDQATGDSLLFDDVGTATVQSKREVAAAALLDALAYLRGRLGEDPTQWRWGDAHTLTLAFPGGVAALNIPPPTDMNFPKGFPRHGDNGTVDVGGWGLSTTNFTYSHGPAIRFVCELDPATGPHGRNALPGGETFDPASPHYRDQMELWRKNQTFDLAFQDADVVASAQKEYQAHGIGRVRFAPAN